MSVMVAAVSLTLIVLVLWDAFEAVLLPRRVTRPLKPPQRMGCRMPKRSVIRVRKRGGRTDRNLHHAIRFSGC